MILRVLAILLCARIWHVELKWTCIAMNGIMEDLPIPSPKWVIEEVMVDLLPRKSHTAAIDPQAPALLSMAWTYQVDSDRILANHTPHGQQIIRSPFRKRRSRAIFNELQQKFGFQMDSVRNMFDHMMMLLDSRASRMTPNQALLSLHADFIGGDNANYRKWYFAAQVDLDDSVGFANVKLGKTNKRTRKARATAKKARGGAAVDQRTLEDLEGDNSLEAAEYRWKTKMNQMSQHDRARQVALYLCCWGEANQVRFVPECLCFIFKCCNDYLYSPECQSRYEPLEEGYYLNNVITPLYQYIRDQGYEISQGKYVRREKDHNEVIGYDDINQLFWYPQGIERIVLQDKTRLIDVPQSQRYFKFNQVEWKKVFFKTYKETRSWFHMATNFNRIWIIHITIFWYYTAFNSPTLLMKNYVQTELPSPSGAAQWSSVALGGAVACLIMILATFAEWAYVPRQFAGSQPLSRRLMFLIFLFVLNVAPSVYIFAFNQIGGIALTIGVVHFFISLATFFFFSIMPIGALFGNLFQRNSRRYLANRLFTANYPRLRGNDVFMSYGLWLLVFAAKFSESYAFLTLSLRDPIRILSIMEVSHCGDKLLQSFLCTVSGKNSTRIDVCHRFGSLLPRYVFVVHYLEYDFLGRSLVLSRYLDLDTLEERVFSTPETYLLESSCHW